MQPSSKAEAGASKPDYSGLLFAQATIFTNHDLSTVREPRGKEKKKERKKKESEREWQLLKDEAKHAPHSRLATLAKDQSPLGHQVHSILSPSPLCSSLLDYH